MKVRFILEGDGESEKPVFDKTLSLPAVPEVGETVGIDSDLFADSAELVEVGHRRWYVNGEEPVVEVWLTRHSVQNQWVHSGCRYGYEGYMASLIPRGSHNKREALDDLRQRDERQRHR